MVLRLWLDLVAVLRMRRVSIATEANVSALGCRRGLGFVLVCDNIDLVCNWPSYCFAMSLAAVELAPPNSAAEADAACCAPRIWQFARFGILPREGRAG